MFTGIIETTGKIINKKPLKGGFEFEVESSVASKVQIDDSVSHSGVCLTVVKKTEHTHVVQAVEETLRKTTLGSWNVGTAVNIELCLTPHTRLDGHIVQGHVDTMGTIAKIENEGANWLIYISYPKEYQDLIVGRGSITVDGISLTVAEDLDAQFKIAIIPYTWEHTTLNQRKVGDKVNLEFDILGKYVLKYLKNRFNKPETKGLTANDLAKMGY